MPCASRRCSANLLNNAAKYTAAGRRHRRAARARESDEVVIAVRDNGVGIAAGDARAVFDMFVAGRAASPRRAQGGLGIGLTLVQGLVELHGGSVEARSEGLGQGSEFTVRLPLARRRRRRAGGAARRRATRRRRAARRVLVVDDNRDAADSLADAAGAARRTRCAWPLRRPSRRCAGGDAFAPDVALLDIGMPGMDGYEVARRMRADPAARRRDADRAHRLGPGGRPAALAAAGFDHHLVKPADPERLQRLLRMPATLLAPPPPLRASPEAGPPRAGPG